MKIHSVFSFFTSHDVAYLHVFSQLNSFSVKSIMGRPLLFKKHRSNGRYFVRIAIIFEGWLNR